MIIKIKKTLLKENKLDSYSNIWKRWNSLDDIYNWSLSQVYSLAKYRKGEGNFNFKFHDKVYQDLKDFLDFLKYTRVALTKHASVYREISSSEIYKGVSSEGRPEYFKFDRGGEWEYELISRESGNVFSTRSEPVILFKKKLKDNNIFIQIFGDLIMQSTSGLKAEKYKDIYPLSDESTELTIEFPEWDFKFVQRAFRTNYSSVGRLGVRVVRRELVPNKESLLKILKNLEKTRESYPWSKRNLPNIQKHLGIFEKKVKKH